MSERIGDYRKDWSLRHRESKASSGKLATTKMFVATLRKNFAVDLARDSQSRLSEKMRVTALSLASVLSDKEIEVNEKELTHPINAFSGKSKMIRSLLKASQICSEGAFMRADGIYTGHYFAENVNFHELDKKVARKELPSHAAQVVRDAYEKVLVDEESGKQSKVIETPWLDAFLARHNDKRAQYEKRIKELELKTNRTPAEEAHLMRYIHKLESNKLNPLSFDSDERIAAAMEQLTDTLIESISVDEKSQQNIAKAIQRGLETGKKVILNVNHAGHSDSYVVQAFYKFLLQQGIIPGKDLPLEERKKLRFLCGFYMAFTPGIRQYLGGINVLLVPGLNDMDFFAKKLGNRKLAHLFSYIKKGRIADPMGEIGVVFSGGGRGPYGGLKEEMPQGTYRYLEDPNTIIVDVHMTNTDKIYMSDSNKIAAFNRRAPQKITFACGEPYVGGSKTREKIFEHMVAQRDNLQPQRKGAESNHKLQEKILLINKEIAAMEKEYEKLPNEDFLKKQEQHELAEIFAAKRKDCQARLEIATARRDTLYKELNTLCQSGELGEEALKINLAQ